MSALKNKRILYYGGANAKDEWMLQLSKAFEQEHHTESFFLNVLQGGDEYFISKGVPKESIHSIVWGTAPKHTPDVDLVRNAEKKYDFHLWSLWQITAPRKKARLKLKSEVIISWATYVIKETEKMIQQLKPDYVILQGLAAFDSVIIHNVLKGNGVKILHIMNSRVPGRFTINNNLQDRWPLVVKAYEELQARDLTAEERKQAEQFITAFKEKPFKPDDSAKVKEPLSKKLQKYKMYLKILWHRKQIPDLRQFTYPIRDKLMDYSGIFEKPPRGEKYVFYPLHIDPETSTSLFGKWFVNQLDVIEKIAKALPCDYKLYVKEHVHAYSSRPRGFHKEIKKFPNVRLISPHANTVELLKDSALILTITGTVGWEGLLLQKPVIAFGNVFYTICDEVTTIRDITQLPQVIEKQIGQTPDKEKTLKFVAALFKGTFPGMGTAPGDNFKSLEPTNIKKLVEGITTYVQQGVSP